MPRSLGMLTAPATQRQLNYIADLMVKFDSSSVKTGSYIYYLLNQHRRGWLSASEASDLINALKEMT